MTENQIADNPEAIMPLPPGSAPPAGNGPRTNLECGMTTWGQVTSPSFYLLCPQLGQRKQKQNHSDAEAELFRINPMHR